MPSSASDYTPQSHQSRFHASDAPEKLFLAGVGSGKTLCGVHECVFLAMDNPDCDGCITSPTYQMLRDVVLPLWQAWVPESLYEFKKADQQIIWKPTGRKIFLRSADRPDRLAGLNLAWAWLDEAAQLMKPNVWRILQARIRDPMAKRRCLFTTTTPEGLNWLIREFRKPGIRRHLVIARTADNQYLPEDFEAGLRATYGEEYAAQYLDAVVLELSGAVWPYVPAVHSSLEPEQMVKRSMAIYGGVDWGFTNPAALVVGGVDYDGRWYLLDSWYKRGVDRDVVAQRARELNAKWGVTKWWSDHDPEGVGHMRTASGTLGPCMVELAEKAVDQGVQHVRSLFPIRGDGQPRIYVDPSLDDWRREVDGYFFPEDKEVPVGQFGDHAMDATRYMIYTHSVRGPGSGRISLPEMGQANEWGTV